ncbi:hypothetical protein KR018_004913 [Drosophila ironensis]|nr:hypothetical protein KR018_004913 [Drosophila ironensis]
MLYLEDYLEMIEHLPQELRDRFTEMRELDLAVQNNMDSLDKKAHMFFKQCKRDELQHECMDTEFHSLRGEYFKVMEDADEKVAIATQIHELVERYLRRLDSELFKFKCELEADNNGITEILERRSLELDGNSTAATALLLSMNQKENRYYGASTANSLVNNVSAAVAAMAASGHLQATTHLTLPVGVSVGVASAGVSVGALASGSLGGASSSVVRQLPASLTHTVLGAGTGVGAGAATGGVGAAGATVTALATQGAGHGGHAATSGATVTYLQQLGSGASASSAIAAAASQAIVATKQMQQGRRTASLNASYEASLKANYEASLHGAGTTAELWTQAGQGALQTPGGAQAVATGATLSTGVTASAAATQAHGHGHGHGHGHAHAHTHAHAHGHAHTHTHAHGHGHGGHHHSSGAGSASAAGGSHHHHPEKKQKKKVSSSQLNLPATLAVQPLGASATGGSLGAAATSSLNVEAVEMLSLNAAAAAAAAASAAAAGISTNLSGAALVHASLGLQAAGGAGVALNAATATAGGQAGSAAAGGAVNAGLAVPAVAGLTLQPAAGSVINAAGTVGLTLAENGQMVVEQANEGEWSYDPNEPRYCTCNQVSYGDMVACDNDACPYEWFHYPCVGITQPPKGKWYCPKCTASMRRRGNRKN